MSDLDYPPVEPGGDDEQPADEGFDPAAEQQKISAVAVTGAWLDQLEAMIREAREYLATYSDPAADEDARALVRSRAAAFLHDRGGA